VELAQAGMRGVVLPPPQGSERKVAPMTVSSPNVIEIKVDRLIDDMRFLRSQMIAFDRRLNGFEAYLKPSEPSEQQPESKSSPWFAAAATATARIVLFAVGAAAGAALTTFYLVT
jgi:hypothetical protein